MKFTLDTFYTSYEWKKFREGFLAQKLLDDGDLIDEITHKPILQKRQAVLHHKQELTEENVNDFNISLNPNNIQLVSMETHSEIHARFGALAHRHIYITSDATGLETSCDLIVDWEKIHKAVGDNNRTLTTAWQLYNRLLDAIYYRDGKWLSALIIAKKGIEFNRIKTRLGAEEI